MNLNNIIKLSAGVYSLLEKLKLESNLDVDYLLDKNFPQLVSRLQSFAQIGKIAICSTNGKTTTLNIFNQILKENLNTYITNINQLSKKYPLLLSIILNLKNNPYNNPKISKKDYYSMALDEFELLEAFSLMKFDYLLLNNILIDQKDSLSLFDKQERVKQTLCLNSKLSLIVNEDEPMYYRINEIKDENYQLKKLDTFSFGFESIEFQGMNSDIVQKNDIPICPNCSCKLEYKKRFYSHLGHYHCDCGFKRQKPNVCGRAKIFSNYTFLDVFFEDNKFSFKFPLSGIDNAYCALGSIALALKLGIDRKTINSALNNYSPSRAYDDVIEINDKKIKIKTIKNPTSLTQAVSELYGEKKTKVVVCFNDNPIKDGKDTGWIWDSNLEAIKNFDNNIYISSDCLEQMALRLKYAKINTNYLILERDIKNAIECCYWDLEEKESMLILTTPSLIEEVYKSLSKKTFA